MGAQLRWLERTPDKREVGGSSPLVPTKQTKRGLQKNGSNEKENEACKNKWTCPHCAHYGMTKHTKAKRITVCEANRGESRRSNSPS